MVQSVGRPFFSSFVCSSVRSLIYLLINGWVGKQTHLSALQAVAAKLVNATADKSREESEQMCQELMSREQVRICVGDCNWVGYFFHMNGTLPSEGAIEQITGTMPLTPKATATLEDSRIAGSPCSSRKVSYEWLREQ